MAQFYLFFENPVGPMPVCSLKRIRINAIAGALRGSVARGMLEAGVGRNAVATGETWSRAWATYKEAGPKSPDPIPESRHPT